MNATFTKILIRAAKNAVNAALTSGGGMLLIPATFHFHSWTGVLHVLEIAGSAVLSRELLVWGPLLLKWSQTEDAPAQ